MFESLSVPPPDPVLAPALRVAADPFPGKVDLGLGIYKDETGRAPVLESVKRAEAVLLDRQDSKAYISFTGSEPYNQAVAELLLGPGHPALAGNDHRARTIQTPGGTGALRLAADFLTRVNPGGRVWVSDPSWLNHRGIFARAGHPIESYPYYSTATGEVSFEAMLTALAGSRADDTVVIQGGCHNPTGADLAPEQWRALARLFERTGALPLIDLAYQGFAAGLDQDAAPVRMLAERLPELLVATSCSKNFALYRDRAGALTIIGGDGTAAANAYGHAVPEARTNWSFPPDHGAAVVELILRDPALRELWEGELAHMRDRMNAIRAGFAAALSTASGADFGWLARHHGMFSLLDIPPDRVEELRTSRHIYLDSSGRINVAGLTAATIEPVARALAPVLMAGRVR